MYTIGFNLILFILIIPLLPKNKIPPTACQCQPPVRDVHVQKKKEKKMRHLLLLLCVQQFADSDTFIVFMQAGLLGASIIHQMLTWTKGSLTCACDVFTSMCTYRGPQLQSLIPRTFVLVESSQNLKNSHGT